MSQEQIKDLCKLTREQLRGANRLLTDFLDHHSLPELRGENPGKIGEEYVREYLSDLRHLSVFCNLGYEKVSLVLRRAKFNEEFAEKVLNEVVHACVHNFYYPRNEVYEEDRRYTYTGRDAIKFREEPPAPLKELTLSLFRIFGILRYELVDYEADCITVNRMQKHATS